MGTVADPQVKLHCHPPPSEVWNWVCGHRDWLTNYQEILKSLVILKFLNKTLDDGRGRADGAGPAQVQERERQGIRERTEMGKF